MVPEQPFSQERVMSREKGKESEMQSMILKLHGKWNGLSFDKVDPFNPIPILV
jgi:hypothetical protein